MNENYLIRFEKFSDSAKYSVNNSNWEQKLNQYDEMSEDLTSMMIVIDGQSDRTGLKSLMKSLERVHFEACKASQILRENSAKTSGTRLNLVQKPRLPAWPIALLGAAALNLVTSGPLGIL
jgi:hypothetical protein